MSRLDKPESPARRRPFGRVAAAGDRAVDRVAIDAAGIGRAASVETQLVGAQFCIADDLRVAARLQRALDHLEFLLQREIALRGMPRAGDFGRYDPQVRGAVIAAAPGF